MSLKTVYLVTGGNRGIGLGLVKALLARPATTVIATVRNATTASSLKAEPALEATAEGSKLLIIILDAKNDDLKHSARYLSTFSCMRQCIGVARRRIQLCQ